ncbi:MAG TPA: hypothetical protein VK137_05010, partial [Planctomycetaceae bacterium]|nr:hypothetical protein [Planctomycetaceae bacterium]
RFADSTPRAANLPTFLVTGPHADRNQSFENEFAKYSANIRLVQSWPYAASDFVLLDQVPPARLDAERVKCQVRLYRVKSNASR